LEAGVEPRTREAATWLVEHRESPRGTDPILAGALVCLNDADALSFFSWSSPGFVDYFGLDHARRKVRYTLARMSPHAQARLARVRLRADVARILAEAAE